MRAVYILIFLVGLLTGCGGGITGTGDTGGGTKIQGLLMLEDGSPLSGAIVTNETTGDTTVSQADGSFVLDTDEVNQQISLTVEKDTITTSVLISDIPSGESTVDLQLQVHEMGNEISVTSISIAPIMPDDPTPTPGDDPTPMPTPQFESQISGELINFKGFPIEGAVVRVSPEVADKTDRAGDFQILLPELPAQLTLTVEFRGQTAKVNISNIPQSEVGQQLRLRLTLKFKEKIEPNQVGTEQRGFILIAERI